MKILHVAWLDNNKANGVSNVVPHHIKHQSYKHEVALLNCSDIQLDIQNSKLNYPIYTKNDCPNGDISKLLTPFCTPDIVIFHGIYFYYFCKVYKKLIKNGIPYIVVPHGDLTLYSQKRRRVKKIIGNVILFNKFIKKARAVQYLSKAEKKMSSSWSLNSFVCGNGMDLPSEFNLRIKNSENFNLTFIGRLEPYHKGLDVLIEACNSISTIMRENNMTLTINGPDDHGGEKIIRNLVKKYKIEDIVKISGPLYENEKIEKLNETDVFVLTSRFEGQPLAIMEALSYGIPVLTTPGTTISDDIEEYKCGWSAEFNTGSIAKKILEAFNSKHLYSEYSQNAKNYARDKFSWESIAEQSISHYDKLLK